MRPLGATKRQHPVGEPWVPEETLIQTIEPLNQPLPLAYRDRALIIFAYLAALTNEETVGLKVRTASNYRAGLFLAATLQRVSTGFGNTS